MNDAANGGASRLSWTGGRSIRILDFDTETRKIGFHQGGRFSPDGCEPTAVAASWVGQKRVYCWSLGEHNPVDMLQRFKKLWDAADCVTGHYIRKFDIPILVGAMLENGLPLLGEKLVCDTKLDLKAMAGLSRSQENLSDMLEAVERHKFIMSDARWRKSNRLTPEGIKLAKRRAKDDVKQHKELRLALLQAGALKPPRMWYPQ